MDKEPVEGGQNGCDDKQPPSGITLGLQVGSDLVEGALEESMQSTERAKLLNDVVDLILDKSLR